MSVTLRARLTAFYTLVIGVLLVALSLVSYRVLDRQLNADATARLVELMSGLHGYLRFADGAPSFVFDASDADQAAFIHEATRYYQIYDAHTGQLIVQSTGMEPLGLHFTPAEVQTLRSRLQPFDIRTDYGRFRIASSVVSRAPDREYLLQVATALTAIDGALGRYVDLLRWRVPVAIVIAALAAWVMASVALAPLSRLAVAASAIDVTSLSQRLPLRGVDDELDHVARSFNDTLARLDHAVGEMRQFSAALAHELRTPLAALRGEIELALRTTANDNARRMCVSQLEELDKLKRLIDQILTLARAESGQIPLTFKPVDVDALAATLVEQLEPIAQSRNIDLGCHGSGAVIVDGDAGWLQRLLLNLIDNALKFTGEHGRVAVRVLRDEEYARLEVRDTGVGMSPEVSRQAFERFFRADPARASAPEGAGLGLSLVQWIVDRHRGRIGVESRVGVGSTFTVWLPLAHPAGAVKQH